jgi:hypothetical protein
MNFSRTLIALTLTLISITGYSKTQKPTNPNEDGKVLSCTVGFRTKGGVTYYQTQKQAWQLPEKKGFVELKSIADVEISLSKESSGKTTTFTLTIKQDKHNLGEIKTEHHSFAYSTPVDVKIEDGDQGWQADSVQINCDSTTMSDTK